MSVKYTVSAAALALCLIACGGKSEEPVSTTTSQQETNRADSQQVSTSPSRETRVDRPASKTIWDKAAPFKRDNLLLIYRAANADLFTQDAFRKYAGCYEIKYDYDAESRNEFTFKESLDQLHADIENEQAELNRKNGRRNGEPYLLEGNFQVPLGDYDFDQGAFAFDAMPYDFLEERLQRSGTSCSSQSGLVSRPVGWPKSFKISISNPNAVQSLEMPQDQASSLISKLEDYGARRVQVDLVLSIEPDAFTYIDGNGSAEVFGEAKITAMRVRIPAYGNKGEIVAEFSPDHFAGE